MISPEMQTPSSDDFDRFLADAEEQAVADTRNAEYLAQVQATINSGLISHNVDYFVDAHGTQQQSAIDALRGVIIQDSIETADFFNDDEQIDFRTRYLTASLSSEELALYAQIGMLTVVATTQPISPEAFLQQNKLKTTLIAEWVLKRDLPINSPWVDFLNDVVPGDSVSASEIENALIDTIASAKLKEEANLELEFARTIARSESHLEDFFQAQPELELPIFTIALTKETTTDANFQSEIHGLARQFGVSPADILKYIEVVRTHISK